MPLQLYVSSEASAKKFLVAAAFAGTALDVHVVAVNSTKAVEIASRTPFNTFPVLVTGKGSIARSPAILKYIATLGEYSGAGASLITDDVKVDQWVSWAHSSMETIIYALSATIEGASAKEAESIKSGLNVRLSTCLQFLNTYLLSSTFLAGDSISLADTAVYCALFPVWESVKLTSDIKSIANIARWFETVSNNRFVKSVFSESTSTSTEDALSAVPEGSPSEGWSAVVGTGVHTSIPCNFRRHRQRISEVFVAGESLIGSEIIVCGWARTIREGGGGSLYFIALHDGSCFDTIQVVAEKGCAGFEEISKAGGTGSSFKIVGKVVASPAKGQSIEINATSVSVLGCVEDPASYPLSKKRHTLEALRDMLHLRPRTNTFGAVVRIRNACAFATHQFFQERGFYYIHTPIITTSDCEGAGEMFQVTTLLPSDPKGDIPRLKDGTIDMKKEFFNTPANLTVSGQLQVEAFSCSMSDVYTFGPTFRAENSHTSRHLAEFWMIEPEIAFATLQEDMQLAEDYLKFCTQYVLDHCASDLAFFEQQFEKGLIARLRNVVEEPFMRLDYTEAINLLLEPQHQKAGQFKEKVFWGVDLASEHERYLTEQVFKKPVILINYPKDIKAFYMKLNPDGKTVAAMDILVPKIGEIIGGSQREDSFEILQQRMQEMKVPEPPLKWYQDLRRYGSVPHAGFGLGFERLVMYVTGIENIRDAIPFPRWPGNASL